MTTAREMSLIVRELRREVMRFPATTLEQIAEARDPFKILISCILSLQTRDAVTAQTSRQLYAVAQTPEEILALSLARLRKLIYPSSFYKTKAQVIHGVCRDLIARFDGRVPEMLDQLLTLKGVGRKTANLVVTMGFGQLGIAVDTHVHRISNRLGWVTTKSPDHTELALRASLPPRHWIEINELLVTFGQHVCTPLSPKCSQCAIAKWCARVGVTRSR